MRSATAAALVLLLIVVGLFGIGSWSCNQPPKPDGEPEKSQQATAEYCSTYYGAPVVGLHSVGPFVKANKDEITAASTFIIAIFTTILGIFTVSLARSTRGAAEAAKRSADAAVAIELPIIKVEIDQLSKGVTVKQGIEVDQLAINFVTFSNVGRTKAFPVALRYGFAVGALPKKPRYPLSETFAFNDIFDANPAKPERKFLVGHFEISKEARRRIDAGKTPVWFYCKLEYLYFMQDRDPREAAFIWCWQNVGMGMGWRPDETAAYNR